MTYEDIEEHFRTLGWTVETITDQGNAPFLVVRDYTVPAGSLAGTTCDLAIQRTAAIPYQPPPAIHTRPHLVPMDQGRFNVLVSSLGPDWQYWSRTVPPERQTPSGMVAHIATVFAQVVLP